MKNIVKSGICTLALLGTSGVSSIEIPQVNAASNQINVEQPTVDDVTKSVQSFIDAFEAGNASEAAKHVKDLRENGEASTESKYVEYVKQNKKDGSKIKLISITAKDDKTFEAVIQIKENKEKYDITLPVVKEQETWKLVIDGSVSIDRRDKSVSINKANSVSNTVSMNASSQIDSIVLLAGAIPLASYYFPGLNSHISCRIQ